MIAHVTWGMGFDLYPLQTIESKKQYCAQAIPENWLTVFTHDPAIPWACVEKDEIGKMAAQRYNDPLFFGNFLVKLILLT
jgi:hypothetical protein